MVVQALGMDVEVLAVACMLLKDLSRYNKRNDNNLDTIGDTAC